MDLEPIHGVDLLTAHERHATVSWLWEGMLAAGNVTLLTSVWKAGKSSLLALLLAGRREGAVLLGRLIEAGASAVVSEEPAELWRRRARNLFQFSFSDQSRRIGPVAMLQKFASNLRPRAGSQRAKFVQRFLRAELRNTGRLRCPQQTTRAIASCLRAIGQGNPRVLGP